MKYLNESMQAVVVIACEKHSPAILEKLNETPEGNWFVLPAAASARVGYVPHVSAPHSGHSCAILGFVERMAMPQYLQEFKSVNADGSLCPDCIAYEWQVIPTYTAATARDLVCGQMVGCDDALTENYHDELFFFCSAGCRDAFRREPNRYLNTNSLKQNSGDKSAATIPAQTDPTSTESSATELNTR